MADAVYGRVDADGRLVAAEPRLLALHERAGGALGSPIAVPVLASLARLARTLGILVSRSVIVAEGDHDLDLWVRAKPDNGFVDLNIGGWTPRPQRAPWLSPQPEIAVVEPNLPPTTWRWSSDETLRVTAIDAPDVVEHEIVGQPLTRFVRLIENADGDLPVIEALATASDFARQPAARRDRHDEEILLSGVVRRDAEGKFIGYDGFASGRTRSVAPAAAFESEIVDAPVDTAFAEHLGAALRMPLGRIVKQADSIRAQEDGPLRRDYADYAGDIASAARHLLALVDDLADLQAIERTDFRADNDLIDIADIARRAAGLLQVRAADRGVRIDRPGLDEALPARGEFKRVLQILVNLIGNAVRYSPQGSMIWIRTERDGDSAVLIVADQGMGIAPADQRRIFEKFERVNPSEPGGSGLGLYIARRLARAMGGDISVDSAPGQGARFVLTLPAV